MHERKDWKHVNGRGIKPLVGRMLRQHLTIDIQTEVSGKVWVQEHLRDAIPNHFWTLDKQEDIEAIAVYILVPNEREKPSRDPIFQRRSNLGVCVQQHRHFHQL